MDGQNGLDCCIRIRVISSMVRGKSIEPHFPRFQKEIKEWFSCSNWNCSACFFNASTPPPAIRSEARDAGLLSSESGSGGIEEARGRNVECRNHTDKHAQRSPRTSGVSMGDGFNEIVKHFRSTNREHRQSPHPESRRSRKRSTWSEGLWASLMLPSDSRRYRIVPSRSARPSLHP